MWFFLSLNSQKLDCSQKNTQHTRAQQAAAAAAAQQQEGRSARNIN
jgi:hypothetical protein